MHELNLHELKLDLTETNLMETAEMSVKENQSLLVNNPTVKDMIECWRQNLPTLFSGAFDKSRKLVLLIDALDEIPVTS
jgi:hypothetical protein